MPKGDAYVSKVNDTLAIIAYTIREDSLKTDSLSTNLLGAINDPAFGVKTATLYTQILLREINVDFGTNPTIDSVILSLAVDKTVASYGDASTNNTLSIRRMEEIIDKNQSYYSTYRAQLGENLGTWTGKLTAPDTAWFDEDGETKFAVNTLRIPLNNSLGDEFVTDGVFGSNEVFLDFLNGLALVPEQPSNPGQGNIVAINKFSDNSKLVVYYNGDLRKEFDITGESQNLSVYETNVSLPSAVQTQLSNPGLHYNETYLQSMGGLKLRLEIPEIYALIDSQSTLVIHEAKIELKVKEGTTDVYPAPKRLLLLQPAESDGSNAFITDLIDALLPESSAWIGHANYDGSYNETTGTYTFRFTRHLQSLINTYVNSGEDKNRGFYVIIPSDNPITPSRLILDTDRSGNSPNLKLKVTYSKL